MEVEKRSSKGRFLNLFDWNGKSRRKLFSDNCDRQVVEEAKKGKGNGEASIMRNFQMDFVEECAISSHEPKAPGVVARLMGLDSLPFSGEPKIHKVQNQKIDRFQTEILPPKSVKPTALTHNKPLSPINSSTSVPLRIRELKLRVECVAESSRIQQSKKQNISGRQNLGKKITRTSLVSEQKRGGRNRNSSQDSGKEKQVSSNRPRNNALRQNTQKQNSSDSVSKNSSAWSNKDRKMQLWNESISKIVNKVAVRDESSNKTVRNKKHALKSGDSLSCDKILSRNDTMSARYDFGTGQSMDVVSFTFSSPLKRYSKEDNFSCNRMTLKSEFSGTNGDSSLNVLLEQKLRELKDKMELYNSDMARTDSLFTSPSSLKDEDSFSCSSLSSDFDCSSVASTRQNYQAQLLEVVEELSCDSSRKEAVFVPATAFPVLKPLGDGSRDDTNGKNDATNWELEYVKNILNKAELTLYHRVSDQEVVNRSLFDELESQETLIADHEDWSNLQRKVLFDRTNEWLDEKFRDLLIGSPKSWTQWEALVRRKSWVTEEVYREINGQICIGDRMVDVLVDEDMGHSNGKWCGFGGEIFDEGAEIGNRILWVLVDELVKELRM